MPQKMWKHSCSQGGSSSWICEPVCRSCGGPAAYDGWFGRNLSRWPVTRTSMGEAQRPAPEDGR